MWIEEAKILGEKVIDCCNYTKLYANGEEILSNTINICYGLEMYVKNICASNDGEKIDKDICEKFISKCVFCNGCVNVSTINGRTLKDNKFLIEGKIKEKERIQKEEEEAKNNQKESSHESSKGSAFGSVSGLFSLVLAPFVLLAKVFHM